MGNTYSEKIYVGIDISKDFFDAALPVKATWHHLKLCNNKTGFRQLLQALQAFDAVVCVMEASGPYYLELAGFLHQAGIEVSVVNPLAVRRFCQMRLSRAKTDKKDAVMIAAYGQAEKPKLWEPAAGHVLALKQLQTVAEGLQRSHHRHSRQLESLRAGGKVNHQAEKSLQRMIRQAKEELDKVEAQLDKLIAEHHCQQFEQLKSIPGLGRKSSMLLLLITGGFSKFVHYKQLISYVGLSPRIYQSGSSVKGKARICKMGMSQVRKVLYVCSWSAIKCNKACRELYERLLARGKAKRLALVAVANKLLKQAFAVVTKGEFYFEKS